MKPASLPRTVAVLALTAFAGGDCLADSYSTNSIADAFVATGPTGNLSGDNFGAAGSLTIESGALPKGEFQSVLEFDLSGAENHFNSVYGVGGWSIQSVTLQLTSSAHGNSIFNPVAPGLFGVSLMANNSWAEGTGTGGLPTTDGISYTSLQNTYINGANDQALGTFQFGGGSAGTSNYSLAVTSLLAGDLQGGNNVSLRLYPADNTVSYLFNSRQSPPAVPELTIVAVPEPGTLELGMTGLAMLAWWNRKRWIRT